MKYKIIKENNDFYIYDIKSGNKVKISTYDDNTFYITDGDMIGETYTILKKEDSISEILSSINYLQKQLEMIEKDNNGDYFLTDTVFPIVNNDENKEEFNEVCEKIIFNETNGEYSNFDDYNDSLEINKLLK